MSSRATPWMSPPGLHFLSGPGSPSGCSQGQWKRKLLQEKAGSVCEPRLNWGFLDKSNYVIYSTDYKELPHRDKNTGTYCVTGTVQSLFLGFANFHSNSGGIYS